MNLYTQAEVSDLKKQKFAFLEVSAHDHVLTITLDRAAKKNALHPQMVNELAYAMTYAHYEKSIMALRSAPAQKTFPLACSRIIQMDFS